MFTKVAATLAAATFLALTVAAPQAARAQSVPSYAQPNADEQIHGRVTGFDGHNNLTVRDEKGYQDNVRLHDGTIINPTGLTLAPGMTVSIIGVNSGSYFSANEIDTPYSYYAGVPYYAGYPWYYYGPTVSLGFFFGNPGWWHGDYYRGGYSYYGGTRVYNVTNVYRSGLPRGSGYAYGSPGGVYRTPMNGAPSGGSTRGQAPGTYRGAAPAGYRGPSGGGGSHGPSGGVGSGGGHADRR